VKTEKEEPVILRGTRGTRMEWARGTARNASLGAAFADLDSYSFMFALDGKYVPFNPERSPHNLEYFKLKTPAQIETEMAHNSSIPMYKKFFHIRYGQALSPGQVEQYYNLSSQTTPLLPLNRDGLL
jgi:hypothetical protein